MWYLVDVPTNPTCEKIIPNMVQEVYFSEHRVKEGESGGVIKDMHHQAVSQFKEKEGRRKMKKFVSIVLVVVLLCTASLASAKSVVDLSAISGDTDEFEINVNS